jgi:hypothetical protein
MSWLLVGEVRRVIRRPEGSTPKFQVQLLAEDQLRNGELRESIFTLSTDRNELFEKLIGQRVSVEASPYPRKDGSLGISMPENPMVHRLADPA